MIPPSVVAQVKRLLAQGRWSGRKIARMTGVSRGTVAAIAQGKRPDYDTSPGDGEPLEEPLGPLGRCPGCGGMAHAPCRLCRTRKLMAQSKLLPLPVRPEEPLHLELRGEHQERYERVRARRLADERRAGKPEHGAFQVPHSS